MRNTCHYAILAIMLGISFCYSRFQMDSLLKVIVEAFGVEDSRPWRIHWDHQIYKVLELHYSAGLTSLVDRLPDISLDLIVRDDQVSFRPELEHARARFYKEVKRFSQIPYNFRGVSDEKDLFVDIGYQVKGHKL